MGSVDGVVLRTSEIQVRHNETGLRGAPYWAGSGLPHFSSTEPSASATNCVIILVGSRMNCRLNHSKVLFLAVITTNMPYLLDSLGMIFNRNIFSIAALPINISSVSGYANNSMPFTLPPVVNPLQDIQLPSGSPETDLPLGDCNPIFKCPKGKNSQLGGCSITFDCK